MKTRTRWGIALLAATGLALVLAFVLSLLAQGPSRYERHCSSGCSGSTWRWPRCWCWCWLVAGVRLVLRFRSGKFGSRLLLKLAGIFALVGVLPGALIYTVSYQFVSRSIEAWFDTRVDSALNAGLALGKGTLDALARLTWSSRPAARPTA